MIFIDASYIIAAIVSHDQWHDKTMKINKNLSKKELITSDLIITESIDSVGKLNGGKIAKLTYDFIKDNYKIYQTNIKDLDIGMDTLVKYDGTLSLVDSVSINIMNELEIYEIVSFDSDFDKVKGIIRIH